MMLRRDTLYRAIKIGALVMLVAYIVPTGGLVKGVYDFPWRLANQVALGILFGGWFLWKLKAREGPVRTSLDWVIAGWLALTLLTTLSSLDRRTSWEMVAYVGMHVLWYYAALDLFRREMLLQGFFGAVAITGTAIAVLGGVELAVGSAVGSWALSSHRIQSNLLNANILGAFLSLTFGFTLCHVLRLRATAARWGWAVALTIVVAAILLTKSRGAWLNLATQAGVILATRLWLGKRSTAWQRQRVVVFGLMSVTAILLLLVALTNRASTNRVRVATWEGALQMVADRPWQGVGPGMYGRMLLAYRDPQELAQLHAHAHSITLTVAAEMGVLSALLLAAGVLLWGKEMRDRLRTVSSRSDLWQRTIALATLAGFVVHSQVDCFFQYPMFAFLLMLLVARLYPRGERTFRSRWWLVLPALAFALAAAVVVRTTPAYALYHQARIASHEQEWERVKDRLVSAVAADPGFLFYRRQSAIALGVSALQHDPLREEDHAGFADAFVFSDDFAPDHAYLACLEFLSGDLSTAITEMERARHLAPRDPRYAFNLATYYEAAGAVDRATELYGEIVADEPSVMASSFWTDTPERAAMVPDLVQRALSALPEDYWASRARVLASVGELEAAAAHYALQTETGNPVPGWVGMARIALAKGDVGEAVEMAEQALSLEPTNAGALLVRARAHLAEGNAAAAGDDLAAVDPMDRSPELLFYLGEVARVQGDWDTAELRYLDAIRFSLARWRSEDTDLYAQLIGRRLPLASEDVQCLEWPYAPEMVPLPAGRLLSHYEDEGSAAELQVLRQMLPYSMRWRETSSDESVPTGGGTQGQER